MGIGAFFNSRTAIGFLFLLLNQAGSGFACERKNPVSLLDQSCVRAVQEALVWIGSYNGIIDGNFGAGTRGAVETFQTNPGTAELSLSEFDRLVATATRMKAEVGYKVAYVSESGIAIGLPTAVVTVRRRARWGTTWENSDASFIIGALHVTDGRSLDQVLEKLRNGARHIEYERRFDDWFVITGVEKSGHSFYVKLQGIPSNLKGFSADVEAARKARYWPIVIAMASDFSTSGAMPPKYFPPISQPPPPPSTHKSEPTNEPPDCNDPRYKVMCE
jgi:Putative peptidoglycan binding domain